MKTDPYFATQDNGAGAPLHFAVTYKQLDMIAHLLDLGAEINQQDDKVSFRARGTSLGGRVCIWRAVRILMVVFGRRRFFLIAGALAGGAVLADSISHTTAPTNR